MITLELISSIEYFPVNGVQSVQQAETHQECLISKGQLRMTSDWYAGPVDMIQQVCSQNRAIEIKPLYSILDNC